MLKFIKGHLTSIGGIEIYPLISFMIFFLFFLAVTWWALRQDKNLIRELSNIPLNDSQGNIDHIKK
jgi:cytochrome c oxidase cbb3-type subunit IV